jgi:hypothetical protein
MLEIHHHVCNKHKIHKKGLKEETHKIDELVVFYTDVVNANNSAKYTMPQSQYKILAFLYV